MSRALPWVGTVARVVLGTVLLVAGLLKIGHPADSVQAVQAYQLLPVSVAQAVGTVLPMLEVAVGALLVLGLFVRWSALVGGLLLLAFSIGIASAWARGLSIDCGCFGGGGAVDPGTARYLPDLVRDAGLTALALLLVLRPRTRLGLDPAPRTGGSDDSDDHPPDHQPVDDDATAGRPRKEPRR